MTTSKFYTYADFVKAALGRELTLDEAVAISDAWRDGYREGAKEMHDEAVETVRKATQLKPTLWSVVKGIWK